MKHQKSLRLTLFILLALLLTIGSASAQSGSLTVLINQVNSNAFPEVAAFVTVRNQNGPVFGLTQEAFSVAEDGKNVPDERVTVQSDNTQTLSLALVIDTSTPEAELEILKTAVNSFVDTLGAQDQVAVVSFYDDVVITQPFSGDKRAVQRAVSSLAPEGNFTAINDALFQATDLVSGQPAGQKAILLFTNSADNISTRSVNETQEKAAALNIPLYFYGYGDRVETAVLQGMAAATGGQSTILADVNQVDGSLNAMSLTLRQGYKVVFTSGVQADGEAHDLVISVAYNGDQGSGQSEFIATPGVVSISFTGVTDGDTVGGAVTLGTQATTPAPVQQVEYLLDGRTLGTSDEAPYAFVWDSTAVGPGLHTLTAYVVDEVGNEGQVALSVRVVEPISITSISDDQTAEVGDTVKIDVKAESLTQIVAVDFLLNGKLQQSDADSPYQMSLDTSIYRVGDHTITAQVRDVNGNTAEADVNLVLTASAETSRNDNQETSTSSNGFFANFNLGDWMRAAIMFGLALLFVPLALAVFGWQRKRAQAQFRLSVTNQGNVRSRYILRAVDEAEKLKFKFTLNGNPLPQRRIAETPELARAEQVGAPDYGDYDYGDMDDDEQMLEPGSDSGDGGGLMQKATGFAAMAGVIGELFYLVGSIMPRGLRTPLQQVGSRMRRGQMAMRRVDRVSRKAGLAGADGKTAGSGGGSSPGGRQSNRRSAANVPTKVWAQTPYIDPSHALAVELSIEQSGFFQTAKVYAFKILSQSIEVDGAPLVVEQAELHPKGGALFLRLIKLLLAVLAFALPVSLCAMAALSLWQPG